LDEPNTGPFCLISTQPWAQALGADHNAQATTAAAAATAREILKWWNMRGTLTERTGSGQ
jgi:hypothetical protein